MYEFTPADPTRKRPGHETFWTEKRKIIFVYIPLVGFTSLMLGVLAGENGTAGVVSLILGLVLNLLGLMWAKIDADELQYSLSPHFTLAVVIFGVFAIIYYLFRSRGLRGGLVSTGWLILYGVALSVALGLIGGIITIVLIVTGVLPHSVLET